MKLKQLLILVVLMGISIYILPTRYYKSFVYLIFILLATYKVVISFYNYLRTKSGIFCDGTLVNYSKSDPEEILNINFKVDLEFVSPTDNKKYIISATQRNPHIQKQYKVWLNASNPEKSIIVNKLDVQTILTMIVVIIIFSILIYKDSIGYN